MCTVRNNSLKIKVFVHIKKLILLTLENKKNREIG